jgi:hypothetical protein
MPSVLDLINFQKNFKMMGTPLRNQVITDSIARMEADVRPGLKPDHVAHFTNFENDLQKFLNQSRVDDAALARLCQTYASFPFFDRFLQKMK